MGYLFENYSQHWVLRPASVRGVEVAKHRIGRYSKTGYSDQVPLNAEIKTYQLAHPVTPIGLREKMKVPKNGEQRKWGKKFLNLIPLEKYEATN